MVDAAGEGERAEGAAALARLLSRYAPAMRAHLVRRKRVPADRAEDLVQGFIMGKVLQKKLLGRADRTKGKFRTFLLTALDRYVISEYRAETAQTRGGGKVATLDALAEPAAAEGASDTFDVAWARGVLDRAIAAMRDECGASGRADVWGVFHDRLLAPTLHQSEPADYDTLIKRYGIATPTQASNLLITGKRAFARCLRAVLAEYAEGEEAIEAELRDLMAAVASAPRHEPEPDEHE